MRHKRDVCCHMSYCTLQCAPHMLHVPYMLHAMHYIRLWLLRGVPSTVANRPDAASQGAGSGQSTN